MGLFLISKAVLRANTNTSLAECQAFFCQNVKKQWKMKSLQHHVKKLAELMKQADALVDREEAAKLIKKAEERAAKIRKRCQSLKENQSKSGSPNG